MSIDKQKYDEKGRLIYCEAYDIGKIWQIY